MSWFSRKKTKTKVPEGETTDMSEFNPCKICFENKRIHWCRRCNAHICQECYDKYHEQLSSGVPITKFARPSTPLVGNKCDFCEEYFIDQTKRTACAKCNIIMNYNPNDAEEFLRAINRVVELLLVKRFNMKLQDETYFEDRYGKHIDDVINRAMKEYHRRSGS